MKIAIASDHRGRSAKSQTASQLRELGHEVTDFGPADDDSVDYPDFASEVAQQVSVGTYDRGILICGTGIGMCITANKFPKIRAVNCHDELTAEMSRRHNDANILCLSGDLLSDQLVARIVDLWLKTEFEGGRHARRVEKISRIEAELQDSHPPTSSE